MYIYIFIHTVEAKNFDIFERLEHIVESSVSVMARADGPRSLPVTINWDRLDSRWIESLLDDDEGSVGSVPEVPLGRS